MSLGISAGRDGDEVVLPEADSVHLGDELDLLLGVVVEGDRLA